MSTLTKFRLALVQLAIGASKAENLSHAAKRVKQAANEGAKLIALPECCNSPYGNAYFKEYAETIPGESTEAFSQMARDNEVFLVAGSIPEREGDKVYNTCTVFNPEGSLIAKFRKIHLFDIDIPGKISFHESKTLTAGDDLATFKTPFCEVGLGICYDMRFAELAQRYSRKGVHLLLYPGAFNMTTGPAHWQLLAQARALDNQLYVGAISPARDEGASYVAWGHSTLVNPWGEVVAKAGAPEEIVYGDIDLEYMHQVRDQIPIGKQRREEVYS